MNRELPDVQAEFRKDMGTRDQIANNHWIIEKVREFQNNLYFCSIDYAKVDCVDHKKMWNFLKRWEYQTIWPVRESVPRQVDRESRGPQGERGLEFSRGKKGQAFFLFLHIP